MIRINARQQGGAVILTIPADILKLKGIKAGDPLGIDVTPEGFTVKRIVVPETRKAVMGPVVCEPLGVRFPTLYRGVVTTTEEDRRAAMPGEELEPCPERWVVYDLDMGTQVVGSVEWEAVDHIHPEDQDESFLIRHHASMESAQGYILATLDMELGRIDNEEYDWGKVIYQTERGIFTFTRIPTAPTWPGPLVIHLAMYPSSLGKGLDDEWSHIVGPEGQIVRLPEFEPPGADPLPGASR